MVIIKLQFSELVGTKQIDAGSVPFTCIVDLPATVKQLCLYVNDEKNKDSKEVVGLMVDWPIELTFPCELFKYVISAHNGGLDITDSLCCCGRTSHYPRNVTLFENCSALDVSMLRHNRHGTLFVTHDAAIQRLKDVGHDAILITEFTSEHATKHAKITLYDVSAFPLLQNHIHVLLDSIYRLNVFTTSLFDNMEYFAHSIKQLHVTRSKTKCGTKPIITVTKSDESGSGLIMGGIPCYSPVPCSSPGFGPSFSSSPFPIKPTPYLYQKEEEEEEEEDLPILDKLNRLIELASVHDHDNDNDNDNDTTNNNDIKIDTKENKITTRKRKKDFELIEKKEKREIKQKREKDCLCVICCETLTYEKSASTGVCEHTFCVECLDGLLKHSRSCPLCRKEIRRNYCSLNGTQQMEHAKIKYEKDTLFVTKYPVELDNGLFTSSARSFSKIHSIKFKNVKCFLFNDDIKKGILRVFTINEGGRKSSTNIVVYE